MRKAAASYAVYRPDMGLVGKLRRALTRRLHRRAALRAPDRPMVSFTFDDVPISAVETGAAILEARGLKGSWYVATGLCGTAAHMGPFMQLADIARLVAHGHEVGCHTAAHHDCARIALDAFELDLDLNARALAAQGAPPPRTFAFPYGDLNPATKRIARERFAVARTVRAGMIGRGGDLAQAPSVGIEGPNGDGKAIGWLERAKAAGAWVILFAHDVRETPSDFGCTPAQFERVVDRALALGFDVVTVEEGARRMGAAA